MLEWKFTSQLGTSSKDVDERSSQKNGDGSSDEPAKVRELIKEGVDIAPTKDLCCLNQDSK